MSIHTERGDTAILVLGMHRSGTSAVTRVLNLLGAHLGDHLLEPQADNAKGFWEHADGVEIHERLLTALGRTWHDFREMPQGWQRSEAGRQALDDIKRLIQTEMADVRLWAIKDPRMCRLAPLWVEALAELGIRATALILVREPYEVASSLLVRDGWPREHSHLLWCQHLLEACRSTLQIPRAMLSYDQLLGGWSTHFTRIGMALGIDWQRALVENAESIGSFISPSDRHHKVVGVEDRGNLALPHYLDRLYHACELIGLDGDWSRLSDLDGAYQDIGPLFAEPVNSLVQANDKLCFSMKDLEKAHEDTVAQADEFQHLAIERMERIYQLEDEVRALRTMLGDTNALAEQRASFIDELDRRRVELEASVHDLTEDSSRLKQRLAAAFAVLDSRALLIKRFAHLIRRPAAHGKSPPDAHEH